MVILDQFEWLQEKPLQPPTVLSHWNGFPNILLFKIPSGALLWWKFHEDDEEELGIFVHLTDDEAQVVYDTPRDIGLLEQVRPCLTDAVAVAWSVRKGAVGVSPFLIPSAVEEPVFAADLWKVAEASTDTYSDPLVVRHAREAIRLVESAMA